MRLAPSWAAVTRRSAPTRRWARGPGLASPRLHSTSLCPPALPSLFPPAAAGTPWWSGSAVGRRSPHPRPRCPFTLSLLSPHPNLWPADAPPFSIFLSPAPDVSLVLAPERLLFPSFLVSWCPGRFSPNQPRDLSHPEYFCPYFSHPQSICWVLNGRVKAELKERALDLKISPRRLDSWTAGSSAI